MPSLELTPSYPTCLLNSIHVWSHGINSDKERTHRSLREWCKMNNSLIQKKRVGQSSKKQLDGGGCKAEQEDLEELLFDCVTDLRCRNLRASRKTITSKAKALVADTRPSSDFKASRGWLQLFMKRKGLSLRRKTSLSYLTVFRS